MCGTSGNLVLGFGPTAPNHPEAVLARPKVFRAVGEKGKTMTLHGVLGLFVFFSISFAFPRLAFGVFTRWAGCCLIRGHTHVLREHLFAWRLADRQPRSATFALLGHLLGLELRSFRGLEGCFCISLFLGKSQVFWTWCLKVVCARNLSGQVLHQNNQHVSNVRLMLGGITVFDFAENSWRNQCVFYNDLCGTFFWPRSRTLVPFIPSQGMSWNKLQRPRPAPSGMGCHMLTSNASEKLGCLSVKNRST